MPNKTTQTPDEELAQASAMGSGEALRELFDRHYTPLCLYARRYVTDADTASDIVQNLFVAIHEGRISSPLTSFRSYAYSTVRNACLNVLKHADVERAYESQTLATATEESDETADREMEQSETLARVARAMSQLPEQCRRIFTMSRVDGLTNQEIADDLGLSKRTVETQISNALRALRKMLLCIALTLIIMSL